MRKAPDLWFDRGALFLVFVVLVVVISTGFCAWISAWFVLGFL